MCRKRIAIALAIAVSGCTPDTGSTSKATPRPRETSPPPPCHPGCFPAGTPVLLPSGSATIESIRAGDAVTTVHPAGTRAVGRVESVFTTGNRLLEVKTAAGTLVTTETQPLALTGGGLRAAGELKAGDSIWRWDGMSRRAVEVVSVTTTARHERVYNLILADQSLFVADGYLARSKPPAIQE